MKVDNEEFEPHPMFEPKTGKFMMADTMEEHLIFKELGLVHEDELDDQYETNQIHHDKELLIFFLFLFFLIERLKYIYFSSNLIIIKLHFIFICLNND